jgi:general secretion pathway protein F
MPSFRYRAMTGTGVIVRGSSEAPSAQALALRLQQQGQFPISTTEVGQGARDDWFGGLFAGRRRLSSRVLLTVTQELAALLGAEVELDRALGMIAGFRDVGRFGESLRAIRGQLRDGMSFGEALAQDGTVPRFYVSMVRAGELGGTLATTLARLADYLARSLAVRETITSALVYPIILVVTAGFSIIVILTLVLPEFEPLFAEAGRTLPWPTRMVMSISDLIRGYWWLLALILLSAVFWAKRALARPDIRLRVDRALFRLPLLGALLRDMEVERLSRTLGTLVANGVALPIALRLASDVVWNRALGDALRETASGLREGDALSDRLERSAMLPAVTLDLIRIGEETGRLDEMLLRQADLDEQRTRHALDRLLALLVPALTIVMGIIVAGLIACMLVAILSVNDLALQ